MLKKLFLLVIVIVFASSFIYAGPGLTPEQKSRIMRMQSTIVVRGDAVVGINLNNVKVDYKFPKPSATGNYTEVLPPGWITSVTRLQINTTDQLSMYDLLSNGTPNCIAQNPGNPNNIHTAYMWDNLTDPVSSSANRRVKYWYSTDKGVTWTFIANVPDVRAGYCAVDIFNSSPSKEIFINHAAGTTGGTRTETFLDAFEGIGSFSVIEPGDRAFNEIIWPRGVMTSSSALTNKMIIVGSVNSTTFDSSFTDLCTSYSPAPGTWNAWQAFNGSTAETYKMARGSDGRIGFVYKSASPSTGAPNYGDIYFCESTDNGSTFSTPLKIFDANFSTDSLAGFRGLDIVYAGTSAKVVFETVKQTQLANYFPGAPNNIRFWSPILPGSDPNRSIIIVDTIKVGYHPAVSGGTTNDALAPICRCGIGMSGSVIFVSLMSPYGPYSGSSFVGGVEQNSFNSIWLTASGNGGLTWKWPQKITPWDSTILGMKDWTFPSISKWNDTSATTYYANMVCLMDSIPGSYYSHPTNGYAVSKFMFMRVAVSAIPLTLHNTNEIADNYALYQNYPNPFNPTTKISFALPKASIVTLKVFDINGRLIETLLNNETVVSGINEINFNASRLASGIYFYKIEAGDFQATKRMILVK
jgi:hypothetical protein